VHIIVGIVGLLLALAPALYFWLSSGATFLSIGLQLLCRCCDSLACSPFRYVTTLTLMLFFPL
jgi:hypothetical protein